MCRRSVSGHSSVHSGTTGEAGVAQSTSAIKIRLPKIRIEAKESLCVSDSTPLVGEESFLKKKKKKKPFLMLMIAMLRKNKHTKLHVLRVTPLNHQHCCK